MRVAELMRCDFALLHRDDSVEIAAKAMAERGSDAVLIEGDGRLVGLLTARDLLNRVTAAGRDPSATPLWQIMSANPCTCAAEDEAGRAAAQMAAQDIEQMPVVDRAGRPLGLLRRRDLERMSAPGTEL